MIHILYGHISFQENDVHFRYGNWEIPSQIIANLKEKYCATTSGELCITAGDKGDLRSIVKIDRMSTLVAYKLYGV